MQSVFNTLVPRPVGTDSHVSGRLLTKQHLVFFTLLLYVHLLFGLLLLHSSMEHCKTCGWCIFKADTMSPDHSFIIAIIRFWPPAWDLVHVCRFPHLNLFLQLLVQFCQQSEFIGILYNLQEYNQQAAVLAYFKETNSARMQKKILFPVDFGNPRGENSQRWCISSYMAFDDGCKHKIVTNLPPTFLYSSLIEH